MKVQITKKKEVFNFCEPYVIAEIGSNHNGDMDLAKKLIKAAKDAGADCVKFQSWSKDTIFSKKVYNDNYFLKDDYRNRTDYTLEQIVEDFSISEQELLEMKNYADELGIDCTSTPFSKREADFLVNQLDTPFIKVASMDLNNYPFLDYISKLGKPIIMSTGLSNLAEIDKAISVLEKNTSDIVILHCVAIYPPKDEDVNLNVIETFQKNYPYPIGYSDHSLGYAIPLGSVVKGACLIEKHFTLDQEMFGWDHKVSANPEQLEIICSESKRLHKALGSARIQSVEDEERKNAFRRSIVFVRDMKKGEKVTDKDIEYKRPGSGLAPEYSEIVVGRTLVEDVQADDMLSFTHLQ